MGPCPLKLKVGDNEIDFADSSEFKAFLAKGGAEKLMLDNLLKLKPKSDAKENGTSSAEGSSKEGTIKEEPGSVRVRDDGQTKESGKDQVGGVPTVPQEEIPKVVYRGMYGVSEKEMLNQLKSFKNKFSNSGSFLHSIMSLIKNKPETGSGIGINWFGKTLFTSARKDVAEQYAPDAWNSGSGGVIELYVKKKDPIVITRDAAEKLIGGVPKTRAEVIAADKILDKYNIDGVIAWQNDIAWRNPEDVLGVKRAYRKKIGKSGDPIEEDFYNSEAREAGKDQVEDNNSTGIKNRIYDAERAAEGKPVIDTSTGKSKAESYEETVKKIDEGDITPEDIDSVREIAKSGKPNDKYSSEQVQHILIYDKVDLNNQYKKVSKEIVDNADSPSSVAQLQFQRAAIDAKMYDNYVASKKSGTEWSAAGRARQVEVNSDFTVSNLINDYKAAYPGKEIPETVRKQIEKLSFDLEDANKRIDDVLKSRDALNAEIEDIKAKLSESHAKSEIDNPDSAFNKRRAKRSATKEQAKKLILDGKARLAAAAKAQRGTLSSNPFSAEMVSAMKDIVEGHVIEKYTDFADLMDRAYQDVKEILPDISMSDFRDTVFEYGKKKTLNDDPHVKQMREIGRLGRLTSAYEDVVSGEAPKRSGLQRDVPTEAEKKIKREITNEMRKRGIEVDSKSPEDKWKTALESFKTRLKNEELALDQAKENGKLEELLKSKKREKTKLDEEAELLKERVGRKKKEARNIIKQRELEARPWLIKTLDEIKNMKKLFLVSGGSTLETLMGAAWWRAAFKIPNDIISYGLSNIPGLNKISKNALAENIGTRNDLAKSIASYYKVLLNKETYTKGAVEKFKTGSAKEEVLHGNEKDHILPSTKLLQAVQKWVQLHGAIKYPVFKAKFESAYETILANMIRKGENPESELVQEKAKGLALVEGLRDILNNDNDVVKAQRMIEGFAKNKGNEFAAITIGAQFPITKIASNYFSEMASTLPGGGLARSTPSLIKAIIKGGESLTPEQSDFVMRNLRQTTFGTGLALLGYYGYKQVSPFYGSVRKSTPAPDDNSIFGMNSHLTHNVGFEIMRFFATLHWKQDEAERLHKEGGTSEGLAAGAKGALLKNPYINQVTRLVTTFTGDDSSEKKIEKFVKEELKQTFVPPDIQKIAKYLEIPGFENFAKKKLKEEMDERASPTAHLTKEQKELNKSEMEAREEAKKLLCEQLGIPYVPPKSQQKKPHKSSLFRLFQ